MIWFIVSSINGLKRAQPDIKSRTNVFCLISPVFVFRGICLSILCITFLLLIGVILTMTGLLVPLPVRVVSLTSLIVSQGWCCCLRSVILHRELQLLHDAVYPRSNCAHIRPRVILLYRGQDQETKPVILRPSNWKRAALTSPLKTHWGLKYHQVLYVQVMFVFVTWILIFGFAPQSNLTVSPGLTVCTKGPLIRTSIGLEGE